MGSGVKEQDWGDAEQRSCRGSKKTRLDWASEEGGGLGGEKNEKKVLKNPDPDLFIRLC